MPWLLRFLTLLMLGGWLVALVQGLGKTVALVVAMAAADDEAAGWFPFAPANTVTPGVIGLADWLEKPAGRREPVRIEGEGFVLGDGTPIKFWGVNLGNLDNAPEPEAGRAWADRAAKHGVNCVRLHKFIPDLMVPESSMRFNAQLLDQFDRFTHALRERGLYYGLSWIFGHQVRPEDR